MYMELIRFLGSADPNDHFLKEFYCFYIESIDMMR